MPTKVRSAGAPITRENGLRVPPCEFDRPDPAGSHAATFASEQRAEVGENRIGQIEHHLERPEPEQGQPEYPSKPSCIGEFPQNLGHGFAAKFHRPIGHQHVYGCVSVPDIQVWMEVMKDVRIITDWV